MPRQQRLWNTNKTDPDGRPVYLQTNRGDWGILIDWRDGPEDATSRAEGWPQNDAGLWRFARRVLPDRLYKILCARMTGTSREEIARRFKVTTCRMAQLEQKAIFTIRNRLKLHGFREDDFF